MELKGFSKSGYLLAAVLLVPGMSLAVTPRACTPAAPTAESYTWNFPQEATRLLNGLDQDAQLVHQKADRVRSYESSMQMDWQAYGAKYMEIRHVVNDMGAKLCRLETIRTAVKPWQRRAIDRNAGLVQLMADNTEDAINYINANQGTMWVPTFKLYAANLYKESGNLSNSVGEYLEYAQLHAKAVNLRNELGTRNGS